MSKYIKTVPLSKVEKISIVFGGGRTLARVKADAGCSLILNGGLYDFATGRPAAHLKADGTVYARESWGAWGYAWDVGPDLAMRQIPAVPAYGQANYITCLALLTPWDGMDAKLSYDKAALGGVRGRSALALTGDCLVLYCSGDGTADAETPEALRAELHALGAESAMMLDSGGSSQCDFGGGQVIRSARLVNNYICVWLKGGQTGSDEKKEDKPMSAKTVCLDPGHGPATVNGSPDGSYKEKEFTWDMYKRLRPLLEARGVRVIGTRGENETPSLTARASVSNKAGADLFVSIHSNADRSGWTEARGLMIYTSVAGENAGRNKAARAILARMREEGVSLHGSGLAHNPEYTVLTATTAPAMIVEYGFHTNKEDAALLKEPAYRDKLARATARGICDYLGVPWQEDTPWYIGDRDWAVGMGLTDGARPLDACTRAEAWAMLHRLYEAVKAGK